MRDQFQFIQDPSLSFLRELTSSSFMIGNIIGGESFIKRHLVLDGANLASLLISGLTIAPLSDKVGRRPILLLCSCGQALSLLNLSIAHDVYSFIGLRALQGMFYTVRNINKIDSFICFNHNITIISNYF